MDCQIHFTRLDKTIKVLGGVRALKHRNKRFNVFKEWSDLKIDSRLQKVVPSRSNHGFFTFNYSAPNLLGDETLSFVTNDNGRHFSCTVTGQDYKTYELIKVWVVFNQYGDILFAVPAPETPQRYELPPPEGRITINIGSALTDAIRDFLVRYSMGDYTC